METVTIIRSVSSFWRKLKVGDYFSCMTIDKNAGSVEDSISVIGKYRITGFRGSIASERRVYFIPENSNDEESAPIEAFISNEEGVCVIKHEAENPRAMNL